MGGTGGAGKKKIPKARMCVPLACMSVSLSSGILCWCWCKDFGSKVREGRSLPALPFWGAGLFPVVSSLAWPVFIPPAVTSLQGLRGAPAFPGLRGSGHSYHYCASLTHASCLFIHLPSECLLLSKFVNSECFKKESQNGIPQDGNKRGTAAVIGSIRTTSPLIPPKKEGPISASWP